tara:strand:- start:8111 stop:9175 length:1065 start_codon:yes stop_codon:yes gene_type:complete
MEAASSAGYQVYGVGVEMREGSKNISPSHLNITTICLLSRKAGLLPKPLRHILTFFELFVRSSWRIINVRPTIIHANDTMVLPIAVFVKFFARARLVYDAHELESDRNGLSKPLGMLTKLVERACWPFVNGLIVVSPSIQEWYKRNIGIKQSEVILNSPVYEENDQPDKGYLREKFGIPQGELVFIYVGILGRGRGIDLILDAFEAVQGAHVVFLGYGEYVDRLNERARTHVNVHVHEAVEHNKVVEVASSADVGLCLVQNVSLSDYYCLPNKLFEYAFANLPVLASDFPDIRRVVDDYSLGRCVELSSESVRSGIKWFIENHENLNPPKKDIRSLSWQDQERKLLKFYQDIIQ